MPPQTDTSLSRRSSFVPFVPWWLISLRSRRLARVPRPVRRRPRTRSGQNEPIGLPLHGARPKTSAGRPPSRTAAGPRPSSWTARSGSPPPPKTATTSSPSASTPTPARSSTTRSCSTATSPSRSATTSNCYAARSPAIEPGRVYVHFGSYGTACLDTATGKVLWKRDDLPCRHYRGPSSSVVLFENLVILTLDGVDSAVHRRPRQEDRQDRLEDRSRRRVERSESSPANTPEYADALPTATSAKPTARRSS